MFLAESHSARLFLGISGENTTGNGNCFLYSVMQYTLCENDGEGGEEGGRKKGVIYRRGDKGEGRRREGKVSEVVLRRQRTTEKEKSLWDIRGLVELNQFQTEV